MKELLKEVKNKIQEEFSVAANGECGPGWEKITSFEKCKRAAHTLSLPFQLQRDNTSTIVGCIATENSVSKESGNTTIGKPICQNMLRGMGGTTEASFFSERVQLKRNKRQTGDALLRLVYFSFKRCWMSAVINHGDRLRWNSKCDISWNTLSEVDRGLWGAVGKSGGSQLLQKPVEQPKRGALYNGRIFSGILRCSHLPGGLQHPHLHLYGLGPKQGLLGLGT